MADTKNPEPKPAPKPEPKPQEPVKAPPAPPAPKVPVLTVKEAEATLVASIARLESLLPDKVNNDELRDLLENMKKVAAALGKQEKP